VYVYIGGHQAIPAHKRRQQLLSFFLKKLTLFKKNLIITPPDKYFPPLTFLPAQVCVALQDHDVKPHAMASQARHIGSIHTNGLFTSLWKTQRR
jgi:hypothetical protein